MKLAGEAGSLLKIEEEIREAASTAKKEYQEELRRRKEQAGYLPGMAPTWERTLFDFSDMTDSEFLDRAEDEIVGALRQYAEKTANGKAFRRRLFVEDAARGFAFVDVCRKRFDVVLMNPPFGNPSVSGQAYHDSHYSCANSFMYASFAIRGHQLLSHRGQLGTICNRAGLFLPTYEAWREAVIYQGKRLCVLLDLGFSIVEDAIVEMCGFVASDATESPSEFSIGITLLREQYPDHALEEIFSKVDLIGDCRVRAFKANWCAALQGRPLAYWLPLSFLRTIVKLPLFENERRFARQGLIPD